MSENFEDKIKKIDEILSNMEKEDVDLNSSVKFYKDAMKLIKDASSLLENAELEIKKVDYDE